MAECDPSKCPTGLAYQSVDRRLTNIEQQTADTHRIVADQAVLLTQVVALREDFKDLKKDNTKNHDEIYGRLRTVESSNKTKITARDVILYLGGTIAIIGGIIGVIQAVV